MNVLIQLAGTWCVISVHECSHLLISVLVQGRLFITVSVPCHQPSEDLPCLNISDGLECFREMSTGNAKLLIQQLACTRKR
jgi:hypothetical protein